jgi:hypothetical protein
VSDELNLRIAATLDRFSGKRDPSADGGDDFPGDFARLKQSVIRPVFESIGGMLEARGHEVSISEETGGKISIHIVPAGVGKSIHPYEWFPTFSVFGAPFRKTVGFHACNMRPHSEAASGPRGDYSPAQVDREMLVRALMKFIDEIANW